MAKKPRKVVLNPPYLDEEERDIMESYKRGEWQPHPEQEKLKAELREAARNYVARKNARINVRLPNADLIQIKRRAERDGLPYQTLIASVLHRFATGQLGV